MYFASNDSTGNKITAKLYYLENDKNPSIEYVILYEELNDTDVNPAADTIDLSANLDQPVFTTN